MNTYFIEFRFQGYAKKYLKSTIQEISRRFRAKATSKKVPHMTLFGPCETINEHQLVNTLSQICRNYEDSLIPFRLIGFEGFNNPVNKVVYVDVEPSDEMKELRLDLSRALSKITDSISNQDKKSKDDFKFHTTIAFKDIDKKFPQILSYVQSKPMPNINQTLLRVTIIKRGKILYEYDLIQKRLLNRQQAKNKQIFSKTIQILKERQRTSRPFQRPKDHLEHRIEQKEKIKLSLKDRLMQLIGIK